MGRMLTIEKGFSSLTNAVCNLSFAPSVFWAVTTPRYDRSDSKSVNLRGYEKQVHRYQHRVYSFAYYFLGNREEAEDVTQDVLLRLWNHREEVDEARLLGWLLRVARNACVDLLRRRKVQRAVMTVNTDGVELAAGHAPLPDEVADGQLFQEHLRQALDTLKEPYRSIVILREIQEMKYEEICGALDLPLNTVKVYLHRARKMLREQLSKVMYRETI